MVWADVMTPSQKTRQILELLRIRHQPPEWATFAEFGAGMGSGSSRRIDLFTFNCHESKRWMRVAYEIKVSRSDFNNELADPTKREGAETWANECYFAMPTGLVKADELPEGWGLVELNKGGLRKKKNAMWRDNGDFPAWFVALVARRSEDAPPILPKLVWLQGGQEIDADGLVAAAGKKMSSIKRRIRYELRDEVEQDHKIELRRLRDLERYIKWDLGPQYTEPDKLNAWLKRNSDVTYKQRQGRIVNALGQIRDRIDALLDEYQENIS